MSICKVIAVNQIAISLGTLNKKNKSLEQYKPPCRFGCCYNGIDFLNLLCCGPCSIDVSIVNIISQCVLGDQINL